MKPLNKTKLIGIERLLIIIGIIILMGASFFAGIQICKLYNELKYFNFEYVDSINSSNDVGLSVSGDVIDPDVEGISEVDTSDGRPALIVEASNTIDDPIKINLMLNYVIDCESSGRHEGIWGQAGEYGILQYKSETWDFLSEKYNYEGDWKNQDDQIELFLLTSEQDKYQHWTCYKTYKNNN